MSASPSTSPDLAKLAQIAMDLQQSNKIAAAELTRFIAAIQSGQTPPPVSGATIALVQAQGVSIPNIAAGVAATGGGATAPSNSQAGALQSEANNAAVATAGSPTSPTLPSAMPAGTQTTAPAPPPSAPYAATAPVPGRTASAAQDTATAGLSNDTFVKNAMRDAGMNPNMMTEASSAAMKGLAPIFSAARAVYGQEAGAQAGGLTDFIKKLASDSTTAGGNFFGDLQRYAQGIAGSSNFQNTVGQLTSAPAQNAAYQNLLPLLFAGSNGLMQQAAGDQATKAYDDFNYQDIQNAKPGQQLFTQWLAQQNLSPVQRSIFGGGR